MQENLSHQIKVCCMPELESALSSATREALLVRLVVGMGDRVLTGVILGLHEINQSYAQTSLFTLAVQVCLARSFNDASEGRKKETTTNAPVFMACCRATSFSQSLCNNVVEITFVHGEFLHALVPARNAPARNSTGQGNNDKSTNTDSNLPRKVVI